MNWLKLPLKREIGIAIFLLCLFRIPSFFGPQYSSDEGYYMAIGQGLNHGKLLYVDIWDNKPPFIYFVYAFSILFFSESMIGLRFLGFILSAITIILTQVFAYSVLKMTPRTQRTVLIVSWIFNSFLFEATLFNAENIFIPLVLGGILLFWKSIRMTSSSGKWILSVLAGILWFLASFTKIHPVPEIIVMSGVIVVTCLGDTIQSSSAKETWVNLRDFFMSKVGFLITAGSPIILGWVALLGYYYYLGELNTLIYSLFGFSESYLDVSQSVILFGIPIAFITPLQLRMLLILIGFILWIICVYLVIKERLYSDFVRSLLILTPWVGITMFAVLLSDRNYPHYMLQFVPPFALFSGLMLEWIFHSNKKIVSFNQFYSKTSAVVLNLLLLNTFLTSFTQGSGVYNWFELGRYAYGFIRYATSQQTKENWWRSFDEFSHDRRNFFAETIMEYTEEGEVTYFFGNVPEVYVMSGTVPGYKLVVDYHSYPGENLEYILQYLAENNVKKIFFDQESRFYSELNQLNKTDRYYYETTVSQSKNGFSFTSHIFSLDEV